MKLIVGLGNPGPEYWETRHNIGFMVVDSIAKRSSLQWRTNGDVEYCKSFGPHQFFVMKPQTFMNRSGWAVSRFADFYKIEFQDLLVVLDDVDLPLGKLRIRPRGSAGTHNGLKSVVEQLGTTDFPRMRIGVGRGDKRRDLADFVLDRFDQSEWPVVENVITRAAEAAQMFAVEDIVKVMNEYNTDPTGSEKTD